MKEMPEQKYTNPQKVQVSIGNVKVQLIIGKIKVQLINGKSKYA